MSKCRVIFLFMFLLISCNQKKETSGADENSENVVGSPPRVAEFQRSRLKRKTEEQNKSVAELRTLRESSLRTYFDKSKTKSATLADLNLVWNLHWPVTFDEKLFSVDTNPKISEGKVLPEEFLSMLQSLENKALYEQIREKNCSLVSNADEMEAFKVLYALYGGSVHEGEISNLAVVLLTRGKQLPPSRGDIVVSAIASESLKLADKIISIDGKQFGDWMLLSRSPNPVYRHLAIQSTQILRLNPDQEYEMYEAFLAESDKMIAKKVAAKMQGVQSKKIIKLRKAYYQKYETEKDLEMMKLFKSD